MRVVEQVVQENSEMFGLELMEPGNSGTVELKLGVESENFPKAELGLVAAE